MMKDTSFNMLLITALLTKWIFYSQVNFHALVEVLLKCWRLVKTLIDNKINLYMQKEQLTLLDENGKPSSLHRLCLQHLLPVLK